MQRKRETANGIQGRVEEPRMKQYRERVYAGWLGKCSGVRLGAPVENWTYEQIHTHLGRIDGFLPLPEGKIFKPDDDTAFPMILLQALFDYGPEISSRQFGDAWLDYLGDQHGTLWWGGYGVSTEHTAYCNLQAGIHAPESGAAAQNGKMLAEQIGGQIFSDVWGLIYPGNPSAAADIAERAAYVSHDGEGVIGSRFIAALTSIAFVETEPVSLLHKALDWIPESSDYARIILGVLDFHKKQMAMSRASIASAQGALEARKPWEEAFVWLKQNFGYDRYLGEVPIIPNAGIIAIALLYGNGKFSDSIQIAVMAGWDTDCNAGNVGTIAGVLAGIEGIDQSWRDPMNDEVVIAGLIGARNLQTIPTCADRISDMGEYLMGIPFPANRHKLHFAYPGSLQGFRVVQGHAKLFRLRNKSGQLWATVKKFGKKDVVAIGKAVLYSIESLSANYYGASFSSPIYPGQTLEAQVLLPPDAPTEITAALYVQDSISGSRYTGSAIALPVGAAAKLFFTIPDIPDCVLSQIGIVIQSTAQTQWNGSFGVDYLDWHGAPDWRISFRHAVQEAGSLRGWTYLRGFWRIEDEWYTGSGTGEISSYTGDPEWQDYSVRTSVATGSKHTASIFVRMRGARNCYVLSLIEMKTLKLERWKGDERRLLKTEDVSGLVKQSSSHAEETIRIEITVKGNTLASAVEGCPAMFYTDDKEPLLRGQVGLGGVKYVQFYDFAVFPINPAS